VRRAPGGEVVLQYPLHERFGDHRPPILEPEPVGDERAVCIGGDGGDAVDHAVRKRHLRLDPCGQLRILCVGEGAEHAAGVVAVALDVVATHHGERGKATCTTAPECLDHVAEVGARGCAGFEVGAHGGIVEVELAGDLVDVVAALGDGQGDDAD